MVTNDQGVQFLDNENVYTDHGEGYRTLEHSKNHQATQFNWVKYMIHVLYLNKAA